MKAKRFLILEWLAAGAASSIASSAWSGEGSDSNYDGAGNYAKSGVGMIAFDTVSGGAGAALTGRNFKQGAVTRLVVSGLNHGFHEIEKRMNLRENIENGGLDPDAKPEMTSEFITGTLNKKVDGLQASYAAGGKPNFIFSDGKSENVAEHNLSKTNR